MATKKQLVESAITKIVKRILFESYSEQDLKFVNGKALIKKGNKILAKVFDRNAFHAGTNAKFNKQYPYSLEIPGMGTKECESIDDVLAGLNKYVQNDSRVGIYKIGESVEFGEFGKDYIAWRAANLIYDDRHSGVTLGRLYAYLEKEASGNFSERKFFDTVQKLKDTGDYVVKTNSKWELGKIYYKSFA